MNIQTELKTISSEDFCQKVKTELLKPNMQRKSITGYKVEGVGVGKVFQIFNNDELKEIKNILQEEFEKELAQNGKKVFQIDQCQFLGSINFNPDFLPAITQFSACIFTSLGFHGGGQDGKSVTIKDCVACEIGFVGIKIDRLSLINTESNLLFLGANDNAPIIGNEINIGGGRYKKIEIWDNQTNNINITNIPSEKNPASYIEKISIVPDTNKIQQLLETNIKIKGNGIYRIKLKDFINESKTISFEGLKLKGLAIKEFSQKGGLFKILDSTFDENSKIYIENSNLGNSEFFNCNFQRCLDFTLCDCILSEIKGINVTWPEVISAKGNADKERENYRQLKFLLENNKDRIQSLKFEAKEYEAYRKYLKTTKGNFKEKVILWSNKWSNDHGQNWIWPVGENFFSAAICFILIGLIYFGFNWNDLWYCHLSEFGRFFLLVNPAHDLSKLNPDFNLEGSAGVLAIDYLSRIISSYLIFQIIRAFRKFTR